MPQPQPRPRPRPEHKAVPSCRPTAAQLLSLPRRWLALYDEFISKNASQVSQIESALRSLTYVIPGRFRDAEIASESIHSGVQLLSLYHDHLLSRAVAAARLPPPSAHARYTRFWVRKSALYRRVATVLQTVIYSQLLCEMIAKRRGGDRTRWRVVILLETIKVVCRLLLLRATRARPILTPPLPERDPVPENDGEAPEEGSSRSDGELASDGVSPDADVGSSKDTRPPYEREWLMPRTGLGLPPLPDSADISSYLLGRVLTADDIKPASKLLNRLQGSGQAAEVLHILAPLIYAVALARRRDKKAWTPWLIGLAIEYAARQLRDRSLRTTTLERDEWNRRAWAMGWWTMRGAFYDNVTKGVVGGLSKRMPSFIAGILDDYEYLWETYYFSTSA